MNVETEDAFTSLLELAANNDIDAFKKHIDREPSSVDHVELWYGRQKGSNQMVLHHKTPLMVAATYGSIDVLKLIVSLPGLDVNQSCGNDKITPLHCAASGGSVNAVETVKILLEAGADPNLVNEEGQSPFDVITVPPKLQEIKYSLQMMLSTGNSSSNSNSSNSNSPLLSPEEKIEKIKSDDVIIPSPKREYPIDPSLPDIKNEIYTTDEFRMFSFKVRPCSRAYSHDWTECPFVHPGENARRRDPRKYHYSCVPCPEFRKGSCRRNDMCEYAHGVFESWLHPAQYRTRLCKDGTGCNRRVCFFAHTQEELRPLYISTGSAISSPRANPMDFGRGPQQNVPPALHLPGSNNFQPSSSHHRLRSSLNAQELDLQLRNEMTLLSPHQNMNNSRFSGEGSSSPRYSDQSLAFLSQFQQNMLSPSKTSFTPNMMSPRGVDPISPVSARFSMLVRRDQPLPGQQFRSLSSHDLGSDATWSSSFEVVDNGDHEPDLSWVQSLVKDTPQDVNGKSAVIGTGTSSGEDGNLNDSEQIEQVDPSVLGDWLEQMQLDQLMAK